MLTEKQLKQLQKADYKVFGQNKHSAVKLCHWTKCSIKSGRVCYKQKWYGIKTHRCIQMTPALTVCNLRCTHCWRDHQYFRPAWKGEIDKADVVAQGAIDAQLSLLTGLGGVDHDKKLYDEAKRPNQVAISLDGEPTMYPYLSELIEEFHNRKMTTFLVSNGLLTDVIKNLNPLPYQLYLSLTSNSKEMFIKTQHPLKEGWENLQKTIEIFPSLKTRRVLRLTLVKNLNMNSPEKWASLVEKAKPDFVESKSYMAIGASTKRLPYKAMPAHEEVTRFTEKIAKHCSYNIVSEKPESRVVLMRR